MLFYFYIFSSFENILYENKIKIHHVEFLIKMIRNFLLSLFFYRKVEVNYRNLCRFEKIIFNFSILTCVCDNRIPIIIYTCIIYYIHQNSLEYKYKKYLYL